MAVLSPDAVQLLKGTLLLLRKCRSARLAAATDNPRRTTVWPRARPEHPSGRMAGPAFEVCTC